MGGGAGGVKAFHDVLADLAEQVARDGEGARKLVEVVVEGAASDKSARKIAMSIANSPLVKTAIAGEDANWGRVVMAVGKAGEPADRDKLSIGFGGVWTARNGLPLADYDETPVAEHLKGREIDIAVDLGQMTANSLLRNPGFDRTLFKTRVVDALHCVTIALQIVGIGIAASAAWITPDGDCLVARGRRDGGSLQRRIGRTRRPVGDAGDGGQGDDRCGNCFPVHDILRLRYARANAVQFAPPSRLRARPPPAMATTWSALVGWTATASARAFDFCDHTTPASCDSHMPEGKAA